MMKLISGNDYVVYPNKDLFESVLTRFNISQVEIRLEQGSCSISGKNLPINDYFFLVESGTLELRQHGLPIAEFEEGDFLGCFDEIKNHCYLFKKNNPVTILKTMNKNNFIKFIHNQGFYNFFLCYCDYIKEAFYKKNKLDDEQPLFQEISSRKVKLELKKYKKGEFIIREGSRNREVYFLCQGKVNIESKGQVINEVETGDFFGYFSVLLNMVATADVRASGDSSLIVIKDYEFFDLIGSNKFVTEKVLQKLISFISKQNKILSSIKQNSEDLGF